MRNIAGRITGYSILRVLLIEVVVFLVRALPMWLTVASVSLVLIIVWNILKFQFMYLFFLAAAGLILMVFIGNRLAKCSQDKIMWLNGKQFLWYIDGELYYLKTYTDRFHKGVNSVKIARIAGVEKHFFSWRLNCDYMGHIDVYERELNLEREMDDLMKLKGRTQNSKLGRGNIVIKRCYRKCSEQKIEEIFEKLKIKA